MVMMGMNETESAVKMVEPLLQDLSDALVMTAMVLLKLHVLFEYWTSCFNQFIALCVSRL